MVDTNEIKLLWIFFFPDFFKNLINIAILIITWLVDLMNESEFEIKVGAKGDIYLKKEFQKKSGINPNDILEVEVEKGKIILKKKKTFLDLARETPVIYTLSAEENKKLDEEINQELES